MIIAQHIYYQSFIVYRKFNRETIPRNNLPALIKTSLYFESNMKNTSKD